MVTFMNIYQIQHCYTLSCHKLLKQQVTKAVDLCFFFSQVIWACSSQESKLKRFLSCHLLDFVLKQYLGNIFKEV